MRKAFTLIEVMVAVLIVSVVIMALLQMRGNITHFFLNLKTTNKINQYSSFFISNDDYGFEKKNVSLDNLVNDFDVDENLRRMLKETKIEVIYQILENIDMSQSDTSESEEITSKLVFEIGKTVLKNDESSTGLIRFKIQ